MPEHLKALAVILVLASTVFVFAKHIACTTAVNHEVFALRRNLWISLTAIAFLSHSFWIYILFAGTLLLLTRSKDPNPLALFFLLLFLFPTLSSQVSGLGVVNYIFDMSHGRLLVFVLLLPAAFMYPKPALGTLAADKFLLGFLLLQFILQLGHDSFTNTLRGAFNVTIDVVLPYFVASRSIQNIARLRDAMMSLVIGVMLLAILGIFEATRHWLLYATLPDALGITNTQGGYLERDEVLRAQVTTGQPIPLGYLMAVALGIYGSLRASIASKSLWWLGLGLLILGLIAPLSRGPWVGVFVMFVTFVAIGPNALSNMIKFAGISLFAAPAILLTPLGEGIVDHLPFVGSVDEGNITYRQMLLKITAEVIKENPLFGSYDFILYLEELRQGQGIIDIVNTYVAVALSSGLVGLGLFLSVFIAAIAGLYKILKHHPDDDLVEERLMGRALISTLLGILVIIFTVSSISYIPVVYWSIAGLCVACTRILRNSANASTSGDISTHGLRKWT